MEKFKISEFRAQLASVVAKGLRLAVPVAFIAVILGLTLLRDSNTLLAVAIFAIPFIALFLITLAISYYSLSYTVTVTDDGYIIETQIFNKTRAIRVSEISSTNWGYLGVAPYSPSEMLLRRFRKSITAMLAKTPDWIGLRDFSNYGIQLVNPKFERFPKYAVSVDFVEEIKRLRPDLVIEGLPSNLKEVQRRRRFAPSFILYAFGIFAILIGLTLGFYTLLLLLGGILIFLGYYTSKQK